MPLLDAVHVLTNPVRICAPEQSVTLELATISSVCEREMVRRREPLMDTVGTTEAVTTINALAWPHFSRKLHRFN
jgi:hypothetical protein